MKWSIFILFLALYGFSCPSQILFDGSERYRIKGVVTDDQGNPAENIHVSLRGVFNVGSVDDDLIQYGFTDSKGKFEFIFSKNNADHYTLYLNSTRFYWYRSQNQINERFAEKFVLFNPERFDDYEFDISKYCSLSPGIPLTFVCTNLDYKGYYNIDLNTEKNIYVDPPPIYQNFNYLSVNNTYSVKSIVPANSKVIMKIYSIDKSYIDSIYVTDIPYTYTLK